MQKTFSNFTLVVFGLIITVLFWLLLEAGLRAALYIKTGDTVFLKHGFVKIVASDTEEYDRFYDSNGNYLYHKRKLTSADQQNPVNSSGFRGMDIAQKRPDSVRIVCFGGSTTYGLGLPYVQTYPKLLQDALDQLAGKNRFEVINAGIPAFKLQQIIALCEHEIIHLQPDIVIVMNVFNNLVTDAGDFAFISVKEDGKSPLACLGRRAFDKCKKYSLLVDTASNISRKGFRHFPRNFHWERGANAIMRSTDLWETLSADMHSLFSLLIRSNPEVQIIVLDDKSGTLPYLS